MKKLQKQFYTRIDEMVILGEKIRSQNQYDTADYSEWVTSTLNLITKIDGRDSIYYKELTEAMKGPGHPQYYVEVGNGILRAIKKDLEYGLLDKLENFVFAEVFSDFIDMAEHLLNEGYKDPAAFLVGATLEEGLRKLSTNNSIVVKESDDISSLSTKLVQAKLIDEIKRKQIMAWKEIRDQADHGKFDKYSKEQVSLMLIGVRDFLVSIL